MELNRFDTQWMQNPEIEGIEYQQGELHDFELREYLLQKFNHQCVYARLGSPCDERLNIDHVVARSKGGTNRASNLVLACRKHNEEKGNLDFEEYCKKKKIDCSKIKAQLKQPLKDAASVSSTRWVLYARLKQFGLPVETGSGGRTKFNRSKRGLSKEHWIDAACVGESTPDQIDISDVRPLGIRAMGHGSRQMCRMDKYGFPRTSPKKQREVQGFRTGDIVKAVVSSGKKMGTYVGRVAVRTSGWFNLVVDGQTIQGISWKYMRKVHCSDGYAY